MRSLEVVGDATFEPLMRVWNEATGVPKLTTLRLTRTGDQFYAHRLHALFRESAVPLRHLELVVHDAKLARWTSAIEGSPLESLAFISEPVPDYPGFWWWLRYAHRSRTLKLAAASNEAWPYDDSVMIAFSGRNYPAVAQTRLRAALADFPMERVNVRSHNRLTW